MHRQHTHPAARQVFAQNHAFIRRFVVFAAQARQLVEEARQAGEAPAVHLERKFDEGLEVGTHARPRHVIDRRSVARHQLALVEHPVEQVMHRQLHRRVEP
jgi:hypothetical protein